MAEEDDRFFQQRLANLRQSRELFESTRKLLNQQTADAGGYFGRLCLQLKDDQSSVKALQEMSSNLLLRIANGMNLFQGGNGNVDGGRLVSDTASSHSLDTSETSTFSLAKCKASATSFTPRLPSRPVDSLFSEEEDPPQAGLAALEEDSKKDEDHKRSSSDRASSSTSPSETDSDALNALVTDELLQHETPRTGENQIEVEHVEDDRHHSKHNNDAALDFQPPSEELLALGTSMEKLSMLCTLINTINFWEDELLLDGSWTTTAQSSAYTLIAAARESQKRLFKMLSSSDHSRAGLCCAAIRELVRAYPPERLLPAGFLVVLLKNTDTVERLEAFQDNDAASFWDMLMTFAVTLMDEHGNTAEQVGSMLLDFVVPALAPEQQPLVEDPEEARAVLRLFLVSHICCRIMYKGARANSSSSSSGSNERSSFPSKSDISDSESKVLKLEKSKGRKTKRLWKSVLALAWKKNSTKSWR
ncbi:hypothetical protein SELMODRAFT_437446 [Selaginella moellendorffii]|uniref:Uncharacterized protein n=2 Tax=Selaginella moellendorffii TaxID=88036 RepID=D8QQY3_SELML|nr:hypothetical protein SELMODRAFT_437446 [Selaginella moellendorffii]